MAYDMAYEGARIEAMCAQLQGFVNRLEQRLSTDVDREFKSLIATGWKGAGADAFGQASTVWHGKTVEMNTTLTSLKTKVHAASTDMNGTDNGLRGLFG